MWRRAEGWVSGSALHKEAYQKRQTGRVSNCALFIGNGVEFYRVEHPRWQSASMDSGVDLFPHFDRFFISLPVEILNQSKIAILLFALPDFLFPQPR